MTPAMCRDNTPVEFYPEWGLYVKREDLSCPGGPNFSKTRGVFAHIAKRPEKIIGVLDTSHSQGGWAVAKACSLLGRTCFNYFPMRKADWENRSHPDAAHPLTPQWRASRDLGAVLHPLQAGRSAVLYHQAKKDILNREGGYMMPNALKLHETISETAKEFARTKLPKVDTILVSASSATIAAGVCLGARSQNWDGWIVIHLGYSRPERAVRNYINERIGFHNMYGVKVIDEGYAYADAARPGPDAPFPCNEFYDLKAFRWIVTRRHGPTLFWNVG